MAKVKNISGDDRVVPAADGRLVLAGTLLEVPVEDVYAYTCQETIWAPGDAEAQNAHDAAVAEPEPEVPSAPPGKNASTEEWANYAVSSGQATTTDVEGKTRDELIGLYGPREV